MAIAHLSRRDFIKTSAAAGALTAAGAAPAFAQGTRLHFLQWSHFIPAADQVFEEQAKEFGKQAGAEIAIERINQNDIQARLTAAIQSGSGPDIVVVAIGQVDSYDCHALEMIQCLVERRKGGETGVKAVTALRGEPVRPVPPSPQQHLERERGGPDPMFPHDPLGLSEDRPVVRGDGRMVPPQQQLPHLADVGRVHVRLVHVRHRRRLGVCPLQSRQ